MRSGIHSRISILLASLMRKECAEWGFLGGLKAHLRGLGSIAPQRFYRGLLANPMLASHNTTHLNYSTNHIYKQQNKKKQTQKTKANNIRIKKHTKLLQKNEQTQTPQLNTKEKT